MQVCFLSQIRRAVLDRRRTTLPSMSSCSEIINKPLQTISKTYSYKSKQNKNKPKNRITNTFTHKSRTCLTFLWNQKAKYQYTEGKEDTLRKKDKNTVCCCFKNQQTSFDPLFWNLGRKLHILQNYANKRACRYSKKKGSSIPKSEGKKSCKYFVA